MNRKRLLHLAVFLLGATCLFAQDVTVYTMDNSDLPYNAVYTIDFDLDGNVWFGGQRDPATGLAYVSMLHPDLETWTVYTQAQLGLSSLEDRVFYLAVDNMNNKWFCTHYGAAYLMADGTAGYVPETLDNYTRTVQTDSQGNVYISDRTQAGIMVSGDYGTTWDLWMDTDIGFPGGLGYRPEIYDLREDSQGRLWLCTWYGVVYRDLEGVFHSIPELENMYTFAMTIDVNDHLWVPDQSTGVLYEIYPDASVVVHDFSTFPFLEGNLVNDLECDGNGTIWFALDMGGLVGLMPDGSYTQYTVESSAGAIIEDNITHMELQNDVIWASGATAGIMRIAGLIEGEQVILGDINNDTNVDILDVVVMVDIILQAATPTEYQMASGDLNADGGIDILDVVQLVANILAGRVNSAPVNNVNVKLIDHSLQVTSDGSLAGLHLVLDGNYQLTDTKFGDNWHWATRGNEIIAVSLDGSALKNGIVLEYSGEIISVTGIAADWAGNGIDISTQPEKMFLISAYPNPFNPAVNITYTLDSGNDVSISIFDTRGRLVETLYNGFASNGSHILTWQAEGHPSGIYFARIECATSSSVIKLMYVK